jgi:glyoxylase-like metal-dependent hydrolase (beta-lactamase superfamily II)
MRRLMPTAALALLCVSAHAQPDLAKVEFKTTKIAESVFMLAGAGGNIGLCAGADGAFLVDDEFAPLTPRLKAAVAAVTDRPLRFVVNTHWHFDHTGGNEDLGEAGTLIVAHENVRTRMSTEQFIKGMNMKIPASPEKALPVVTFASGVTFHQNGEEIAVRHTAPAHTDGDSFVHFKKANVVHAGDLYFNGLYPFFDQSSGGSFSGMIAAADLLLATGDAGTKFIPGHGPLSDRAALQAYRDMLVAVRDAVLPLVKAGKSKNDVVAARPTARLDAAWGGGFLKPNDFVGLVYDSLSTER